MTQLSKLESPSRQADEAETRTDIQDLHDPIDEILAAVLSGSFRHLAVRMARAIALFGVTLLLASSIPTLQSVWTLAFCIAVLSLFNMTKWVAATAIAAMLLVAVLPPQILASIMRM
ncbi:hypothetical protein [Bosea sp. OK403]|uniref:hypothetical protein n=1 Tax=Bosea sp. OK403 TaxID=1855286 RepID=UPI0011145C2C|nr:hypothetical protein [Bosea sp. OK403]